MLITGSRLTANCRRSLVEERGEPSAISNWASRRLRFGSSGRRLGRAAVQFPDHVVREVEAGVGPNQAGVAAAEEHLQRFLLCDLLEQRQQLALELILKLLLQLVDLGLRILLEALRLEV